MSSRLAQFNALRTVGGEERLSWQNLIANLNDFFAANTVMFVDLWIEQRSSTRRGIDKLFAFMLYRDIEVGGTAPVYSVEGNTTNNASPAWFDAVTDAEGGAFRTVSLIPAPTVPGSDAENGKQYLRIKVATPAPAYGEPYPGAAYIGEAVALIPAGGSGAVLLATSDMAAALGNYPVYNLSAADAIQPNERVYVSMDPATGRLIALPSCC